MLISVNHAYIFVIRTRLTSIPPSYTERKLDLQIYEECYFSSLIKNGVCLYNDTCFPLISQGQQYVFGADDYVKCLQLISMEKTLMVTPCQVMAAATMSLCMSYISMTSCVCMGDVMVVQYGLYLTSVRHWATCVVYSLCYACSTIYTYR